MTRSTVILAMALLGAPWGCSRAELVAISGPDAGMEVGAVAGAGGTSAIGSGGAGGGGGTRASCPATVLAATETNRTVVVDGTSRSYLLHVPTAYDGRTAVPLILDFHSIAVTGAREKSLSQFPTVTDPDGVVMAFPQGLSGPSGAAWNVGPCCVADVDDVKFALAVVADIESIACIDASRVYATGFSMGGGMAYNLACQAPDVFAAIAPAAFDMTEEAPCNPKRSVTVIAFRGTGDPLLKYTGGASSVVQGMPVTFLGAQGTFQRWAEIDQCTGGPSSPDADGCSRYSGCKDGADVILCTRSDSSASFADATFAWPILRTHTR